MSHYANFPAASTNKGTLRGTAPPHPCQHDGPSGSAPVYGAGDLCRRYPLHLAYALLTTTAICLLLWPKDAMLPPDLGIKEIPAAYSQSIPLPPPPPLSSKPAGPPKRNGRPMPSQPPPGPQPASTIRPALSCREQISIRGSGCTTTAGQDGSQAETAGAPAEAHGAPSIQESSEPLGELLYVRAYTPTRIEIFFTAGTDSILRARDAISKYPNPYARDVQTLFGHHGYVHQNAHVSLVKISEGYAVNIPKIYMITTTHIVLEGGERIALAPRYHGLLMLRIAAYIEKHGQWTVRVQDENKDPYAAGTGYVSKNTNDR